MPDQEDPFKKYGGKQIDEPQDPFKKYGGKAIAEPVKKKVLPQLSGAISAATSGLSSGGGGGVKKVEYPDTLPENEWDRKRAEREKYFSDTINQEELQKDPLKTLNKAIFSEAIGKEINKKPVAESTGQKYLSPEIKVNEENINVHNQARLQDNLKANIFPTTQSARDRLFSEGRNGVADPNNETDLLAENVVREHEKVKAILNLHRGDIKNAAIEYYANQDPRVAEIFKAGGTPPPETVGALVGNFLRDKNVIELSQESEEVNNAYREAQFNFRKDYPEMFTNEIVQKIAQGREDYGENNPFINLVGLKSSDRVMRRLYEDGKVDDEEMEHYEKIVRPQLALHVKKIPTTGFVENTIQSAEKGLTDIPKGLYDLTGIHNAITTKADRAYDELSEEANYTYVTPKTFGGTIATATGHLGGLLLPLSAGTKALAASKIMNAKTANEVMMGLTFYHDLYKDAEKNNPNGGYLNQLQALVQTTIFAKINPTFGALSKGVVTKAAPQIKDVLEKLKTGSITGNQAKEGMVQAILTQVPKKTLKTSTEMALATGISDAVGGIFSGKYDGEQSINNMVHTFESMLLGTPLLNLTSVRSNRRVMEEYLNDMGSNPTRYREQITKLSETDPEIKKRLPELLKNLTHVEAVKKELDAREDIKPSEKKKYLLLSLQEKLLKEKADAIPDAGLKPEKQLKEIEIEKKMALDPDMGSKKFLEEMYEYELIPESDRVLLENNETGKFEPNKVGEYLKYIAQQANGLTEDWKPAKGGKPTMEKYPPTLLEAANERWAKEIEAAKPKEEPTPDLGFDPETSQPTSEAKAEAPIPGVEGGDVVTEHQKAANEIQRLRTEHDKENKALEEDLDKKLNAAKERGFKEGEFESIYDDYNSKQKEMRDRHDEEIAKYKDAVGGDEFLMKGDKNAKQGHHFSSIEALETILGENEVIGYQKADEGYGGVSLTTDKNLDDKGIVLEYGNERNKNKTTSDQPIRIDFNIEKLKQDGYKTKLGSEDLGTFPNEQEVRIIKDNGSGISNVSETTISDAKKYIDNVQLNKKILGEEKTKELIKKLEKENIPYTIKGEPQKQSTKVEEQGGGLEAGKSEIATQDIENQPPNEPPKPPQDADAGKDGEGGGTVELSHKGLQEVANEFSLPDVRKRDRKSDIELKKEADELVKEWAEKGQYAKNVEELIKDAEAGEILTDKERVVLERHLANLSAELRGIADKTSPEFDAKLKEIIRLKEAGEKTRSEAGAALRIPGGGSLPHPVVDFAEAVVTMKEAVGEKDLTPQQKAEVEKMVSDYEQRAKNAEQKVADMEAKFAEMQAQKSAEKTKKSKGEYKSERDNIRKSIKEKWAAASKDGTLTAVAVPYAKQLMAIAPDVAKLVKSYVSEGITEFSEVVKKVHDLIKDLNADISESDVVDVIAGKYDAVKETKLDLVKKLKQIKDQKSAEAIKIRARIKSGDFAKKELPTSWVNNPEFKKKYPKEYKEAIDAIDAREQAKLDFDIAVYKAERAKRSTGRKGIDFARALIATTKAVKSGIDDSAVMMQNIVAMTSHPRSAVKALKEHALDALSEKRFRRYLTELHESPIWPLIEKSGLDITDPKSLKEQNKEEIFDNNLLNKDIKIRGKKYNVGKYLTRPFERAFTSLGNAMRVNMFTRIAERMMEEGKTFETHPEEFKSLARVLNTETGRGKLHTQIERASQLVTAGVWSPRLMSSRINMLGLSELAPLYGGKGYYAGLTPQMRKMALADMAKFLGAGVALMAFAGSQGAGVDDDPESPTFGTIKVGNKKYNAWGGFTPYAKTIYQGVSGHRNVGGERKEIAKSKLLGSFFRSRLTPAAAVTTDLMVGEDFSGKPATAGGSLMNLIAPLSVISMIDAVKKDGMTGVLNQGLPSFVGVGVSDERDFERGEKNLTKEEKEDPTFKYFIDKGINFPELDPKKIGTKEVNGKVIEHLSDLPKETQEKYIETKKKYLKEELQALKNGKKIIAVNQDGTASVISSSQGLIDKDNMKVKKIIKFEDLTEEQLQHILSSSIYGSVSEKVKKEVLNKK